MTATPLYKVLGPDRAAFHGGKGRWPEPGVWTREYKRVEPCERGWHLCRRGDLVHWLGPVIWTAEAGGKIIEESNKLVAAKARLIAPVEAWNERTARLFAADCAEHVLPADADPRSRDAIAVARRFANGEATRDELAAAWDAAGDAAWDAAAWDAAWDAAAWDAARDAAWAAARDAAWDAAWAAARDAAWDAARDAERVWQTERLFDYLEGRA